MCIQNVSEYRIKQKVKYSNMKKSTVFILFTRLNILYSWNVPTSQLVKKSVLFICLADTLFNIKLYSFSNLKVTKLFCTKTDHLWFKTSSACKHRTWRLEDADHPHIFVWFFFILLFSFTWFYVSFVTSTAAGRECSEDSWESCNDRCYAVLNVNNVSCQLCTVAFIHHLFAQNIWHLAY